MIALTGAVEVMEDPPPQEAPWAPRMDDIRQAQLAEVDALERVVGALASKQQSSITKLRKQVEMIMAWKSEVTAMNRKAAAKRKAENFASRANTSANTANLEEASGENVDAGVTRDDTTTAVGAPEQNEADDLALVEQNIEEWDNNLSHEAHGQGAKRAKVGLLSETIWRVHTLWPLLLT